MALAGGWRRSGDERCPAPPCSAASEQPTSIRFPADLRQRIAEQAAAERRSLSGQALHLLDEALGPELSQEPESPFAEELPGARRLVLDLHERGPDPDQIAASTGLDPVEVAAHSAPLLFAPIRSRA